jgi:TolA-binding protein
MKRNIIVTVFVAFIPFTILSAEPSAFGAGNLDNPSPYGLTSSEKILLENKQKLHTVVVKTNNQDNEVDSLRERIDGLQSVIESLSRKAQENKVELKNLESLNSQKSEQSNEYEKRLSSLGQSNFESIEKIKTALNDLSALIDKINSSYIAKDDFNSLVDDVNKFKSLVVKELKIKVSSKDSPFSKMSNSEVAKQAELHFNKKYYTNAIKEYNYLIKNKYNVPFSYYMLGEMNYRRKNYANAISFFKQSVSLSKKASYMETLMLHTAISMEKTGDTKNATAFYKAVIAKYPNAKEAKEAKKYLSAMK